MGEFLASLPPVVQILAMSTCIIPAGLIIVSAAFHFTEEN